MTNTLTWDIKPIALPKINSNLLSVVSLILLLTMAFLTGSAIADHCDALKKKLDAAGEEVKKAFKAYLGAELILYAAIASLNPGAIYRAKKAFDEASENLKQAGRRYNSLLVAYQDCLKQPHNNQSGGCDSGSCS